MGLILFLIVYVDYRLDELRNMIKKLKDKK